MGCIIPRGRQGSANRAAAISARTRESYVRQVESKGLCRCPQRIGAYLEDIEDGSVQASRGCPHVIADDGEGVCDHVFNAVISWVCRKGAISNMGAVRSNIFGDRRGQVGGKWFPGRVLRNEREAKGRGRGKRWESRPCGQ
jgi:hypothetical protein